MIPQHQRQKSLLILLLHIFVSSILLLLWCSATESAFSSSSSSSNAANIKIMTSNNNNNNNNNKPLIIFCHGSGDTGQGAKSWIRSLVTAEKYQQFEWIFPTAKPIPYQLNNGGMISSVWYDRIYGFDPKYPEQTSSVEQSTDQLLAIIDDAIKNKGYKSIQIAIGGFSMGGAIALQTAARYHATRNKPPLACVFGLSCYLNDDSKVWKLLLSSSDENNANNSSSSSSSSVWPKLFMAHGAIDDFILPKWGQDTFNRLTQNSAGNGANIIKGTFQLIPNTYHDMTSNEIADVLNFVIENVQQ